MIYQISEDNMELFKKKIVNWMMVIFFVGVGMGIFIGKFML